MSRPGLFFVTPPWCMVHRQVEDGGMNRAGFLKRFFKRARISRKRILFALLAFFIAVFIVALPVSDYLVKKYALDWRIIRKLLYYQTVDPEVHQAVDDPDLLFRLKPSSASDDGRVHINRLGFRGAEAGKEKPPGAFRIVCLGGSNVYGLRLGDRETWPARLEGKLNRDYQGPFEVLNGGTPSYVGSQIAKIAAEALERYNPDLFIIGLSNAGSPAFLWGAPVEPYFEKHPEIWARLFFVKFPVISLGDHDGLRLRLLEGNRLYRFYYAGLMALAKKGWINNPELNRDDIRAVRNFVSLAKNHGVKVHFMLYPGASVEFGSEYFSGTDATWQKLDGEGLPHLYEIVHPPAYVMMWYADEISRALLEKGLLAGRKKVRPAPGAPAPPDAVRGEIRLGDVRIDKDTILVPSGTFMMGCSPGDMGCLDDEKPRHKVSLSAYRIDRREATVDEYRACVATRACTEAEDAEWFRNQPGDHPAGGVTGYQADAYCRWKGGRLPTEAQWELAARAGGAAAAEADLDGAAWYYGNSARTAHPVAQKRPNAWGLYDMVGNVWEWCADVYAADYYGRSPEADPKGEPGEGLHVIRGGGWFTDAAYLRVSYRNARYALTFSDIDIGVRCVHDALP